MELPAHTRERIAEIEAIHRPTRVWIRTARFPWLRPVDVCILCRQPYECDQREWAADVKAGRRSPAGWRR
jgi:hypothetical protein